MIGVRGWRNPRCGIFAQPADLGDDMGMCRQCAYKCDGAGVTGINRRLSCA
jgi:hypothetical protein